MITITQDGDYLGEAETGEDTIISAAYNEDGDKPQWVCPDCGAETADDEPDGDEPCDNQGKTLDCQECDTAGEIEIDCEECQGSGKLDRDTPEEIMCDTCSGSGKITETCGECDGEGSLYRHDWQRNTLAWFNAAVIDIRPAQGRVRVNISAADPRGCFELEIWQADDGTLRMGVPYEGMSSPHMPLRHMHGGVYRLGYMPEESAGDTESSESND